MIEEEHRFLFQCEEAEVPVVPPLLSLEGKSLGSTDQILFALFPFRGGRNFDITSDNDWTRLGSLIGRLHLAGQKETADQRIVCSPSETTKKQIDNLISSKLVHPDCLDDFEQICRNILNLISPLFLNTENIRIHGDCHRGNILDRGEEGLLLIDFDDMMTGPPVQDLWLLLPGHHDECRTELEQLLDGYIRFRKFDESSLRLIEPLRFMRMIHFLSWCSIQREEPHFRKLLPDWGTEAFWIKELEDIRYQYNRIRDVLE
jgi:Ser/Thr protein kinase RdoA (MazF antagonist)